QRRQLHVVPGQSKLPVRIRAKDILQRSKARSALLVNHYPPVAHHIHAASLHIRLSSFSPDRTPRCTAAALRPGPLSTLRPLRASRDSRRLREREEESSSSLPAQLRNAD